MSSSPVVHVNRPISLAHAGLGGNFDSLSLLPGSTDATLAQGTIHCLRVGDVPLFARRGYRVDTIIVRCRPIAALRFRASVTSMIFEPPVRIPLFPVDGQGKDIEELQGSVVIDDTSHISVMGDSIIARSTGASWIRVVVGDCNRLLLVTTKDTVSTPLEIGPFHEFRRFVTLVKGEYLALPIPQGWIGIQVEPADSLVMSALDLSVQGANCAKGSAAPFDLACKVYGRATAVVRANMPVVRATVSIKPIGRDPRAFPTPTARVSWQDTTMSACPWLY